MTGETRPLPACPVCEYWDGDHAPECVMSRLRTLGSEGRQAHRRALLLVTLMTTGRPTSLKDLASETGMTLMDVRDITRALFIEGIAYPDWSTVGVIALTTAPHVEQTCLAAAELLGMVLTQPRTPLSPLLHAIR
ncbi:hypothetical protein IHN63_03180 [Deinococcus sp. 6YEL10]|uniref:hypothetical protein n=1 Tax=Deinococcus sp. 6YEL10 TaxID=2745870 RepID=UPI001E2FD697|nr:hypothetical protein [Deinococcus sp. 6YEL10]MCD0160303.1 hypothetical protein [Deinococcus sp. 6YEL10]